MGKEKFVMPSSVATTLLEISDNQARVRMINAICNYEFNGIVPDFTGDELALFEKLRTELRAKNGGQ